MSPMMGIGHGQSEYEIISKLEATRQINSRVAHLVQSLAVHVVGTDTEVVCLQLTHVDQLRELQK